MRTTILTTLSVLGAALSASSPHEHDSTSLASRQSSAPNPDSCKGYTAKNVKTTSHGMTAQLSLAAECGIYGKDIEQLKLEVTYEDKSRIHVKISDLAGKRYEVPKSVFPRPTSKVSSSSSDIVFKYVASPFSFSISRKKTGEVLFDTKGSTLVFEEQYLRLKTAVPNNANIYGLGEHTSPFRLDPFNTTRTLWNRDAIGGIPPGTNLYGSHPIYFEHRGTGTHAVLLLNSNGMDVKLRPGSIEYNVIGGILDFYFIGGSDGKNGPADVARGYAKLAGFPASVPYWSLGLHQCRWGYHNFVEVANVITNYSAAGIPLETMWTDIDYMHKLQVFTNDPEYFPTTKLRQIVDYLHDHDQQYIMMIDPAVAYQPNKGYKPFDLGVTDDIFLKNPDGSLYKGVVWPGVTVYPDWFHPKINSYWNDRFKEFFSPETGFDIDGAWIDMNEPTSFCYYPCDDLEEQAAGDPPPRSTSPPDINTPIFQNTTKRSIDVRQATGLNYNEPPYKIGNVFPHLADRTTSMDVVHANGLIQYNTHNLFGTMMSSQTRKAMLARRPGLKPLVITRSTFAGAGHYVGKWLGDNLSNWEQYRFSIAGQLAMASIYQVPMVGSDVCGFGDNTTETLCARWATLGAFSPFYRNHNADTSISQEFYRWPSVAQAAKNAIDIRYRLMDYMYTAIQQAHEDGSPVLNSLWFKYPQDKNTYPIDLQFFYGDSILVSPVTAENSTSVDIYLPKDVFYDFLTYKAVVGRGATVSLTNVDYTLIPVHIKGGSVLPLRASSAMTTKALRDLDFEYVVAPDVSGKASGQLYVDDGVSIEPKTSTRLSMSYRNKELKVSGTVGYKTGVKVGSVRVLGVGKAPGVVYLDGKKAAGSTWEYDSNAKTLVVKVGKSLGGLNVRWS
ncbi:hypothetical protein FS749_005959 [Ceratobasidium sp. UAMH 11750]|nr:hypothetical protein FS749_005959 [Ceratobasidium sp. UAMH 11750]